MRKIGGLCSVAGCGNPYYCRGYCNKHYLSWRKYGDPLASRTFRRRGTGTITHGGYKAIGSPRLRRFEHVQIAERVLGHPLPAGAQVHHVDGNGLNNATSNLVICPSQAYHTLLHVRQRALDECGNANHRRCWICGTYGDPALMGKNSGAVHHHECRRKRDAERKQA